LSPNPAIDLLNSFYRSYRANNVQIFVVFPAIPVNEYNSQEKNFSALYNLIATELEIPVLGKPEEFLYPEEFFYDTVYHMNGVGREHHTQDIIGVLGPVFQK
jgi:hypothetical protein